MARPTKRQRQIKEAKELLENATLAEIFATRKADIVDLWMASDTVEKREACYHAIIALGELRDAIDTTATDD